MAENSGSYRILASEGDTLTLELYNTGPGDPLEETTQLAITINRDDGSLSINRAAYYPVTGHDLDEVTISPTP